MPFPKHTLSLKPKPRPSDPDTALREALIIRDTQANMPPDKQLSANQTYRAMNKSSLAQQVESDRQAGPPAIYDDCSEDDPEGCQPRPVFFGPPESKGLKNQLMNRSKPDGR